MSCYHPLPAIRYRYLKHPITGNPIVKVLPHSEVRSVSEWCTNPSILSEKEYITVPCGQCIGCRLDHSRDWSVRAVLEAMEYDEFSNHFLTLTYDDPHLPIDYGYYVDEHTGEFSGDLIVACLNYPDVQKFNKRLREYYERVYHHVGYRFYCSGEYGDEQKRPHYHIIAFNLPIPDLKPYRDSPKTGYPVYTSALLDKIWQNGQVFVGALSYASAGYVARYNLKKYKCKDDPYARAGFVAPFSHCSNRPGIARSYYDRKSEWIYAHDGVIIPADDTHPARIVRPPKYFDRLYQVDDPDRLEDVKEVRRLNSDRAALLRCTDLSEWDYRHAQEESHQVRSRILLQR